ncbi:lipopolysaccharide transport periplasmic protein LptA [Azonexus fungiphilus]|uniref:lipopolysaccharide transport periplasmic protein LptA n=1 Tax=Azonexus fungiphilus TaxID=146940 RepID=UPI00156B6D8D|nr:lipopolysaccharide transport periplasmic protein LptA [Azonexus fungiphilus]NHC07119.1 lipopolysaccharide transport periplasmic protein LptA [Azonexus fungiphilus]
MILRIATLALAIAASQPAIAEKADRDKPMLLEAARMSIDDAKKVQILEGDVVITKGTLILRAERIIISEDQYGFQKGIAFAAPGAKATFRQKREGRDDYVEGEAERIEYNSNSEIAELFHRARIRSGDDEVRGDYVWYDAVSEKFLASASETRDPRSAPARVRAVIQPRNKGSEAARPETRGERLELRGASGIELPAQ